jgi:hypothetical protein
VLAKQQPLERMASDHTKAFLGGKSTLTSHLTASF